MEVIQDVKINSIVPIVLHKVVTEDTQEWEDVHLSVLCKLIEFIGDRWIVPKLDAIEKKSGWILTFDDGNISDYEFVVPLLLEKEIKATFFLIVDKIGTNGYLNWSQVAEMHGNGMCIGSHSFSHRKMTMLSKKDVIREFRESKKILEDFISAPVVSFSYPYGECSSETHRLGMDAGYEFLFTSKHGIFNSSSNICPRNSINSSMSWQEVVNAINPSAKTKLKWYFEDLVKDFTKNSIGPNSYKLLRNYFIKK